MQEPGRNRAQDAIAADARHGRPIINKEHQMSGAEALRRELSVRGQQIAIATGSLHELTTAETPSVIFGRNENNQHGNFYPTSYRNICANAEWVRRLAEGD